MSFFESISEPPQSPPPERSRRPAWMKPETVIPGSVPAEALLVRTDEVAVAVGSVRAYPNGFEFTAHVRRRNPEESWPGMSDPFEWHTDPRGRRSPDQALRLGILYTDGRRTATTSHRLPIIAGQADDDELVLQQGGSGGSDSHWDGDFWVHPLPPDGPVTFVASWLPYGVAETRAELDGAAIREAAQRAVILWPDEPDYEPQRMWRGSTITGYSADSGEEGEEEA